MKRLICMILALCLFLLVLSGCRKPENSGNGDNLSPTGSITVFEK